MVGKDARAHIHSTPTTALLPCGASRAVDLLPCQIPRVSPFAASCWRLHHALNSLTSAALRRHTRFAPEAQAGAAARRASRALAAAWSAAAAGHHALQEAFGDKARVQQRGWERGPTEQRRRRADRTRHIHKWQQQRWAAQRQLRRRRLVQQRRHWQQQRWRDGIRGGGRSMAHHLVLRRLASPAHKVGTVCLLKEGCGYTGTIAAAPATLARFCCACLAPPNPNPRSPPHEIKGWRRSCPAGRV
jgi:hypothetical protein